MATADPAAQTLLDRHDAGRLALVAGAGDRLAAAEALRCSRERAVDVLWLLTSFEAFDQSHPGRGLDAETVGAVLTELAEARLH